MKRYVITEEIARGVERGINPFYAEDNPDTMNGLRSHPLEAELQKERERLLDEFMSAIEFRFDDTNNGRGVVGTIRGLRESLRGKP
jgi:hypothetical protein